MRLNKFVAQASGMSRREADEAIEDGRIYVDGEKAILGTQISDSSKVELDGAKLSASENIYLLMNKPIDYVCSRAQQDDKPTIYSLLPPKYQNLKIAGRLDAESHGLIVLTNDGDYANTLMHPRYSKVKIYELVLERELLDVHKQEIENGVQLKDGSSALELKGEGKNWRVTMHEGRNRQIRRTFGALEYTIIDLKRIQMADLELNDLELGSYAAFSPKKAS